MLEEFTQRELDVLKLMVANFSNREIALELALTVETVRWYNKQIYSKLDVHNRRDAVRKAKALGFGSNMNGGPTPVHNLPRSITPFLGRKRELYQLEMLINDDHNRLITITGQGGMGKTRLALATATATIGVPFPHGVYFVPLQPLTSPDQIMNAIEKAIGCQFQPGNRSLTQQVINYLRDKQLLLVLDNFEHLLEGAPLITDLLRNAPRLKVLVTSRECLNLYGEIIFTIQGLQYEGEGDGSFQSDAEQLFISTVKSIVPNRDISHEERKTIDRICNLLEGMPLAIELAASWHRVLSFQEIADELTRDIDILQTSSRGIPERQRSIRAVLDYTWDRMTEAEKSAFMKLSIFRGGFTRDAATFVAATNFRLLMNLVNKSLLRRDADFGRFHIHELLRQYAARRAERHSEMIQNAQILHSKYFLQLAERLESELFGIHQIRAFSQLKHEHENYRVAITWLSRMKQHQDILQICGHIWFFWYMRGYVAEGYQWLVKALSQVSESTYHRAKGLYSASYLAWMLDDLDEAKTLIDESLNTYQELVDKIGISSALTFKGWFLWWGGDNHTARQVLDDSITLCRNMHNDWHLAIGLYWLAHTYFGEENLDKPRSLLDECTTVSKQVGERLIRSMSAEGLGHIALRERSFDTARTLYREALKFRQEVGDKWLTAWAFHNLANVAEQEGNLVELKALVSNQLAHFRDFGIDWMIATTLKRLGDVESLLSNGEQAKSAYGESLLISHDLDDNHRMVILLESLAHLAKTQGLFDRAVYLFSVCKHFADTNSIDLQSSDHFTADIAKLRSDMANVVYSSAWERGKLVDLDIVVQELIAEFEKKTHS